MTEPGCYRVPLDRYPGMNRFVLDWLAGDERFLPRQPPERRPHVEPAHSRLAPALIESNKRWGLDVAGEVQRWASGKTFTIVAGQQVGFGGGPLYTFVKVATLLKMKRDNEARGIPTTILFWLATEDHDFAEVATLALPSKGGQQDLTWLRANRGSDSRAVVGRLPIPETLVEELTAKLGISRPKWLRSGITFGDAFAVTISTRLWRCSRHLGSKFRMSSAISAERSTGARRRD